MDDKALYSNDILCGVILDDGRVDYPENFILVLLPSCPIPPLTTVFSEVPLSNARSNLKFLKALVDPTTHFIEELK